MLLTLAKFIDTASALQTVSGLSQPVCLSGAWGGTNAHKRFDILSAAPPIEIQQQAKHLVINKDNLPTETSKRSSLDWLENFLSGINKGSHKKRYLINGEALPAIFGFIGYISYDYGRRLEVIKEDTLNDTRIPDVSGGIYYWNFINDNENKTSYLAFHSLCPDSLKKQITELFNYKLEHKNKTYSWGKAFTLTSPFINNISKAEYKQSLTTINLYINQGDCYQVNYTHRHTATYNGNAAEAYATLNRSLNTPYSAYLKFDDFEILSLSPERFINIRGDNVETKPIKGTIGRGYNSKKDNQLKQALFASKKDRSENLMIVDLLRNDLNKSCLPGSVKVPELFSIETYPNVHHLVSTITGTKPSKTSALSVFKNAFPGGSITGAPKIRAMEIIEELEPTRRSIYCGSIFYADFNGDVGSNICIRTLLCKENTIYCWGGGGVVADSNTEDEYSESITKVKNLMDILEGLNRVK